MEYNLGMMSARPDAQERGRGTWQRGSEPSPRLLQGLSFSEGHYIVTSPGLGRGPIKFYCGAFLGLELCIRNSVKWQ